MVGRAAGFGGQSGAGDERIGHLPVREVAGQGQALRLVSGVPAKGHRAHNGVSQLHTVKVYRCHQLSL